MAISSSSGPLPARPLGPQSFQSKHREVLANSPRSIFDVRDHHTHAPFSVELKRRTELEWLSERVRNGEYRVDGAQTFASIQETGISDWHQLLKGRAYMPEALP